MASGWGAIYLSSISPATGAASPVTRIWNGTGGSNTEGLRIYKKDGLYYLLIAEGGSGANHAVTIARSPSICGPYESFKGNPIATNRGTGEYFQTVGHVDLFQDKEGGRLRWCGWGGRWCCSPCRGLRGVALGGWPVAAPARGVMSGWERPVVLPPASWCR